MIVGLKGVVRFGFVIPIGMVGVGMLSARPSDHTFGFMLAPVLLIGSIGLSRRKRWGYCMVLMVSMLLGWFGLIMWADLFERITERHGLETIPPSLQAVMGIGFYLLTQFLLLNPKVISVIFFQENQGAFTTPRKLEALATMNNVLRWIWKLAAFGLLALMIVSIPVLFLSPYVQMSDLILAETVYVGAILFCFVLSWLYRRASEGFRNSRLVSFYDSSNHLREMQPRARLLCRVIGSIYLLITLGLFGASFPIWKASGDSMDWTYIWIGPALVIFFALGTLMWQWSFQDSDPRAELTDI